MVKKPRYNITNVWNQQIFLNAAGVQVTKVSN